MTDLNALSPRQRECLRIYWEKRATSKEIAAELQIAPSTVDAHLSAAVLALGARNRREAALLAFGTPSENSGGQKTPLPELTDWRRLIPLRTGAHNDLSIFLRIIWILGIAVGLAAGFGALASGARVISDLFQ